MTKNIMSKTARVTLLGLLTLVFQLRSVAASNGTPISTHPAHLKPFGSSDRLHAVEECQGFPTSAEFFDKYAFPQKPLLMKSAATSHPAFQLWEDDYLQQKNVAEAFNVRTVKKQGGVKAPAIAMKLEEFLQRYQTEELYLVDHASPSLLKDIVLPRPLQCDAVTPSVVENDFWFTSGGTRSNVHIDAGENILCVYRGVKTFFLINPHALLDGKPIPHNVTAYGSIDIDSVDYDKYPALDHVEFYHTNVSAGDCLFVPLTWIHQAKSFYRNVAVNFFFDQRLVDRQRLADCPTIHDLSMTADQVEYSGAEGPKVVRCDLQDQVKDGVISPERMLSLVATIKRAHPFGLAELAASASKLLDKDGDLVVELEDINQLTDEELREFHHFVRNYEDSKAKSTLDANSMAEEAAPHDEL